MKTVVVWFTGLSGSGKSTVAARVIARLEQAGKRVHLLDGDAIRASRHVDLGFAQQDIKENNRRIVEMCRSAIGQYDYVFVTVITPLIESRAYARGAFEPRFVEVYVNAAVEECARRDVKGLYKKAASGLIQDFIGVSPNAPYEPPPSPDLEIPTERMTPEESADLLIGFLEREAAR